MNVTAILASKVTTAKSTPIHAPRLLAYTEENANPFRLTTTLANAFLDYPGKDANMAAIARQILAVTAEFAKKAITGRFVNVEAILVISAILISMNV